MGQKENPFSIIFIAFWGRESQPKEVFSKGVWDLQSFWPNEVLPSCIRLQLQQEPFGKPQADWKSHRGKRRWEKNHASGQVAKWQSFFGSNGDSCFPLIAMRGIWLESIQIFVFATPWCVNLRQRQKGTFLARSRAWQFTCELRWLLLSYWRHLIPTKSKIDSQTSNDPAVLFAFLQCASCLVNANFSILFSRIHLFILSSWWTLVKFSHCSFISLGRYCNSVYI